MRGTSDCCHYDEGYDEGLADGRAESDDKTFTQAVEQTLIAVRAIVADTGEIPDSLSQSEIEDILSDEQLRNSRMTRLYREALAR